MKFIKFSLVFVLTFVLFNTIYTQTFYASSILGGDNNFDDWGGWGVPGYLDDQQAMNNNPVMVTVTFDLNGGDFGGTSDVNVSVPRGSILSASQIPTPSRAGFTFGGWSQNLSGSLIDFDIYVSAVWIPTGGNIGGGNIVTQNDVRVVFNLAGGNLYGDTNQQTAWIPYGTMVESYNMPTPPTRTGFIFNGWSPNIQGMVITTDTYVTAQWVPVQNSSVDVIFNLNGGNINGNTNSIIRSLPGNSTFSSSLFPTTPTRAGYTFNGWTPNITNSIISSNTTVTATWVANQSQNINITFNLNGGTINNSGQNIVRTVMSGNVLASNQFPANPIRPGFTFVGWNPNIANTPLYGNQTITAQWSAIQTQNVTVTFNLNGGNIGGDTQNVIRNITSGQVFPANQFPANPTRIGYTFNGWNPAVGNSVINQNITITAQWIQNQPQNFPDITPAPVPTAPVQQVITNASTVNQIVTLAPNGAVFIGGTPLNYDIDTFGSAHITNQGVSVLPARLSLAILFGLSPSEALTSDLLYWDALTSTFIIDPQGHNIRLTVGSYTMQVGDVQVPILSGSGTDAFPVAVFIDPATGRMFLPTRAIADALGFTVGWDANLSAVTLTP
ncbi:MAG: InlB B-repeat-containing protein [Defluviitaleaceae bacterium]|nr:InlB B-repeat-containing protein [Defluviitaleaceae bacterium]